MTRLIRDGGSNINTHHDPFDALIGETHFEHNPSKVISINFVVRFANVKP